MSTQANTLKKTINLPQLVALYIGAVLGAGILLVPGLAADVAGPASLIAWGVMTLLVFPMGITMGLLSTRFPNAGGVSHFVSLAFGKKWGSLVGWFFLVSVPIGVPVNALTAAGYVEASFGVGMAAQLAVAVGIVLVALVTNWFGMKVAGQVQVAVIIAIVAVLGVASFGAVPHFDAQEMTPFMPHGWWSVGQAAAILFWCFIGWEAVSHLSEEVKDPERVTMRGVMIAVVVVGVLYMMAALATVATGSYGGGNSVAALSEVIQIVFGPVGGYVAGVTAVFINTATAIVYTGAASRVAMALARQGSAPKVFGRMSQKWSTPTGALVFLGTCFTVVFALYGSGVVGVKELIQLPNATFICAYLGGCLAGVKLLKGSKWGVPCAWISLLMTMAVYPFLGWMGLYPVLVGAVVLWLGRKGKVETEMVSA